MQLIVKGASVLVYVNGLFFGRVYGFSWTSTTPQKQIRGLDQTEAFELAPTTASCNGTLQVYRTVGDGGAQGAGLSDQYPTLIREKYFTLVLIERISNSTIFQASQCKVIGESWDIKAKSLVTGNIAFEALEWNNETQPAPQ